jgi:hypothetical protein
MRTWFRLHHSTHAAGVVVRQIKEKFEQLKLDKNEYYQADPSGIRTGNGPGPQLAETLDRVAKDAEAYVSKVMMTMMLMMMMMMMMTGEDDGKGDDDDGEGDDEEGMMVGRLGGSSLPVVNRRGVSLSHCGVLLYGIMQSQVAMRVAMNKQILQEKLDNIRGAVIMGGSAPVMHELRIGTCTILMVFTTKQMLHAAPSPCLCDTEDEGQSLMGDAPSSCWRGVCAAFPMGLPEWDSIRLAIEGEAGLEGTQVRAGITSMSTGQSKSARNRRCSMSKWGGGSIMMVRKEALACTQSDWRLLHITPPPLRPDPIVRFCANRRRRSRWTPRLTP